MQYTNINTHIERVASKMYNIYSKCEVDSWKLDITKFINTEISNKNIFSITANKNNYMGLVFDCINSEGTKLILKNVPNFTDRFQREINCLNLLPKELTPKIININKEHQTIWMLYIGNGKHANFNSYISWYKTLYKKLYDSRIKCDEGIKNNFVSFVEIVTNDYEKYLYLSKKCNCKC